MSFLLRVWLLFFSFLALSACSGQYEIMKKKSLAPNVEAETPTTDPSEPEPLPTPVPPKQEADPTEFICSHLDFQGVMWPETLTFNENTYYALALNITGSFEGTVGWKNITGNFDGQGISLGLLQQNLGQGTLQPLLVEMYRQDLSTMQTHFSSSKLNSMQSMLEKWLNSTILIPSLFNHQDAYSYEDLFPSQSAFNSLDEGYDKALQAFAAGNTAQSVAWARANALDSKGNVLADWKKSFQAIAESNSYRSLQLKASTSLFFKAKAYFDTLGFTELRFLLLMFDFVVQNGSIGSQHLEIYNKWLSSHQGATEEERSLALLEARLTTVKDQYKADVRSRKTTIIKGVGVVHQNQRNLAVEYCFDPRVNAQ